jgi:isopentenyl phosphate kinase
MDAGGGRIAGSAGTQDRGARGCQVVKLGGGLITSLTPEARPELNRALITDRVKEVAGCDLPTVLVHGTGTFGKPPAREFGYLDGRLRVSQFAVVAEVSTLLARMEFELLECVQDAGLHPLRLPIVSLAGYIDGQVRLHGADLVRQLLAYGITPVIGGNFAWGEDGFVVYSSDSIAVELAVALGARSLVMATSVPGVQCRFGETEEIFEHLDVEDTALIDSIDRAVHDVTGGMRLKIASSARAVQCGIPTFIVDGRLPGNLAASLAGHPLSGTRLHAGPAAGAT